MSGGSICTGDDGLPEWELGFRFESGRLCLAFCATVGERWRRNFERLRSPADLSRWVVAAGLLASGVEATDEDLSNTRVLRKAIYRVVRSTMAAKPASAADCDVINAGARHPDLAAQLLADRTRRPWAGMAPLDACLSTLARDTIDLVTGAELVRVRECAAADCALLFLDRSRPGRRRWCSDGACGSRARSASYRRRHDPSTAEGSPAPTPSSGS